MKYWKTYKQTMCAISLMTIAFILLFICIEKPELNHYVKTLQVICGMFTIVMAKYVIKVISGAF